MRFEVWGLGRALQRRSQLLGRCSELGWALEGAFELSRDPKLQTLKPRSSLLGTQCCGRLASRTSRSPCWASQTWPKPALRRRTATTRCHFRQSSGCLLISALGGPPNKKLLKANTLRHEHRTRYPQVSRMMLLDGRASSMGENFNIDDESTSTE